MTSVLNFSVAAFFLLMLPGVVGEDGFCEGQKAEMTCCEKGSGLILPLVPMEHTWDRGVRAFLYLVALLWCFLGVSVLSDTFMAGIEAITNSTYKKKVPRIAADGQPAKDENGQPIVDEVDELIWNPAVANLTLMALGSSTPEILLSIIEIVGNGFFAGDLGPGTVVGSASFNLYVITGICMVALEAGELRKIEGTAVYALTASHSLMAYGWLAIVVTVISPDVVEWWEALITFLAMPWLVTWVYCADKNWFRPEAQVYPADPDPAAPAPAPGSSKDLVRPVTSEDTAGPGRPSSDTLDAQFASRVGSGPDAQFASRIGSGPDAQFASRVGSAPKKNATTYLAYRRQSVHSVAAKGQFKSIALRRTSSGEQAARTDSAGEGPSTELQQLKAAINESFQIQSYSVYHWETVKYGFPEVEGQATLRILRTGKTAGPGRIKFRTEDGTAKAGAQYEAREEEVEFGEGETTQEVVVPLIHDYEWNADLDFFVHLEVVSAGDQTDRRSCKATVTVVDTDKAGAFAWAKSNRAAWGHRDRAAYLLVEGRAGLHEQRACRVRTQDGTALAGEHYRPLDEVLEWRPYELSKQLAVTLLGAPLEPQDPPLRFYVDVVQVSAEGAALPGEATHTADVRVEYRAGGGGVEEVEEELTYGQQIRQALNVNAGGALSEASVLDCIMHWLSIGWKLLAALVPPPHWLGGWATFAVALAMVGLVTAIIGDLASIFGCLVGLEDSVTAFTVVALGTSLPDTFASVLAIRADDNADNAVGNVTGSNSVNVFLGLGFPWLIATAYWGSVGPTQEWHDKYAGSWRYYDDYKESGAFVVMGGSLGFNTMIFSILTCFVFFFLFLRRKYIGGEIGGSLWASRLSAVVLVSVWLIYVLVSALQVYHPDSFIAV